jgi:hypothetical protein
VVSSLSIPVIIIIIIIIIIMQIQVQRHPSFLPVKYKEECSSVGIKALCYKPEGRGFDTPKR